MRFSLHGRVVPTLIAALAVAGIATACSSSSPPLSASSSSPAAASHAPKPSKSASSSPVSSPTPNPSSPAPQGPGACKDGQLTVTVDTARAQGAAGHFYVPIVFTNTSSTSCTLYGYPGVSAMVGQTEVGQPADRDYAVQPALHTIAPGGSEQAIVDIVDANNYPKSVCGQEAATQLRVYPPGFFNSQSVSYKLTACSTKQIFMHVQPVLPIPQGS